jgi:CRISPR/Cas system-associated endonuclease Cas3-HD
MRKQDYYERLTVNTTYKLKDKCFPLSHASKENNKFDLVDSITCINRHLKSVHEILNIFSA